MAVYTNLNEGHIIDFLELYDIGKLISFSGITEGIENSNFHLKTSNGNYILTIFEKRVDIKDIPFFIKIMLYLNKIIEKWILKHPEQWIWVHDRWKN